MSEPEKSPTAGLSALGLYHRTSDRQRFSVADLVALALSVFWLGLMALTFIVLGRGTGQGGWDPLRFVMTLLSVFLPVAMVWVAATAARSAAVMREEGARIAAELEKLRQSQLAAQKTLGVQELDRRLQEIAAAARKTESALATFSSIRGAPPPDPVPAPAAPPAEAPRDEQPSLALGSPDAPSPAEPLGSADLIAALQFPETAEDREGFRALRRALQDRQAAQLIQSAQDVLTLLSEDGIYMDDLSPDRSRPELWRRFARGERGRPIAALGGIRDRSSLALTGARMRNDTIFRDAAHHFLRKFDRFLTGFEPTASDAEIVALTDTRTARAFMLLGRVTGTFD